MGAMMTMMKIDIAALERPRRRQDESKRGHVHLTPVPTRLISH